MPVVPTIDVSALRALNRKLNELDPDLRKQVGKDIKSAVAPQVSEIQKLVSAFNPPRGMLHNGRTAWGAPKVSAYATPGGGRGSVARIEIYGPARARAGVKIADLAGTRGEIKTVQGARLIEKLNSLAPLSAGGRGGRLGWANFIRSRPRLIAEVEKVLDRFAKIAEGKIST